MGYVTPNTVSGSDVLTASLWNTQIRDNMDALNNPPSCRVARVSAAPLTLTILSPTSSAVPFITWESALSANECWDNDGMWNPSTPEFITIQTSGIYSVEFNCFWSCGSLARPTYILNVGTPIAAGTRYERARTQLDQAYSGFDVLNSTLKLNQGQAVRAQLYIDLLGTDYYVYGRGTQDYAQSSLTVTRISGT